MGVNQPGQKSHAGSIDRSRRCFELHAVAANADDLAVFDEHRSVFAGLYAVEQSHVANGKPTRALSQRIYLGQAKKGDQACNRGFHSGSPPGFLDPGSYPTTETPKELVIG